MSGKKNWVLTFILTGIFLTAVFCHPAGGQLFAAQTVYAAEADGSAEEAEEIRTIMSIEPAVAYTFSGILNEKVTEDVLARLHNLDIKGTFFVTEAEMKAQAGLIKKIIEAGHEVDIAIRVRDEESVNQIYENILRTQKTLKENFGVETNLIKQPYGVIRPDAKVAVKRAGLTLIGHSVSVVQSKHKDYTSSEDIMSEIFGRAVASLYRGQIVHFRMDYYTHDHLIGELLELIKQRRIDNIAYEASYDNPEINPDNDSRYALKTVQEMLNNKKFQYQYPVPEEKIPLRLRPTGLDLGINSKNLITESAKRYIGNKHITYDGASVGFSKKDDKRFDKTGRIATDENIVFLTFDDWGGDATINKLLYVLRKHKVPGTFFVLTNNVLINTNLLRAIAEEGHEIANHSDKHLPMAIYDTKRRRYVPVQPKEEYTEELGLSYKKLAYVVGDVTYNGNPVLTRYFRPPTLAISKNGFEAIFANNYEYIVSGSFSTGDYALSDIRECVEAFKEGLYTPDGKVIKGAILVMHFSDTAIYTPMALDILLTANAAKPDSDPSKFKVGRLSDYLKDGYSQTIMLK